MQSEGFTFLLDWAEDMEWTDFIVLLSHQRRGISHLPDRVRAVQLAADVDGQVVGRASIRFELNEALTHQGGHIGFGVLPHFRRRGYATEILRQSVVVARSEGVARLLLTCHDDNVGSASVIEACGGHLETVIPSVAGQLALRRYWIGA